MENNLKIKIPKDYRPGDFQEPVFSKTYTKEELFEFAMYCSGHRKHMIEFRFEEFINKSLPKLTKQK